MSYRYRGLIKLDPTYVVAEGTLQGATFEVGELSGDGHVDPLVLGTDFPVDGSAPPPDPGGNAVLLLGAVIGLFDEG